MSIMRSTFGLCVVFVAFFGTNLVEAKPGILDLFNFETKFGPPPVRTVYVVKPSHGHGHGHHSHSHHGPPSKTIIKYVTKPPSSSHSISPFSIFSKPFSSGGWSSLSHGHSSGGRGKGKTRSKPMSMVVDEETFTKLAQQEESNDDENSLGGGRRPMIDDMNQMVTSTRGNSDLFDAEDPNAQVEVVNRPQSMRGIMRPPPTSSNAPIMMSQGRFETEQSSQPLRSQLGRSRPKPTGRNPSKPSSANFQDRPSTFDDDESSNSVQSGPEGFNEEEAEVSMMAPVRGRGRKPSKQESGGSSGSGGWSSSGPKTVTYVTRGWGGPPSGGWGGWSSPPVSHGWPSSFDEDDYWPIGGGGGGWSSPSSGGWSSGGPAEIDEVETPEEPETGGPGEMVDEVGTTEEGEDRRPPSAAPMLGRRPGQTQSSSVAPTAAGRRPSATPSSPPIRSNSAETNSRRPITMPGRNVPVSSSQPQQQPRQKLPRTNEPQPEYLDVGSGGQPEAPRPVYGPPVSGSGGSSSSNGGSRGQLMIGGQPISNEDGLLDEELIRTVQQIIQTFDKN